ncbi:hypothetical protein RPC_3884 [Rhodopseudomonas palustris BisB18]|uniref:Uncharacterized protein n=1 Tax=Rhodopseudomonas palustris (strain BisB18) TaxID=316056 RepID=Q20ZM3_RHOPB
MTRFIDGVALEKLLFFTVAGAGAKGPEALGAVSFSFGIRYQGDRHPLGIFGRSVINLRIFVRVERRRFFQKRPIQSRQIQGALGAWTEPIKRSTCDSPNLLTWRYRIQASI